MRKILVLGGGENQLSLIRAARKRGYYIVLCDKDNSCVGCSEADSFFCVDIVDEEAVFKVAKQENVNGIVSNSEVVMGIVARVATRLDLIGNPIIAIETLASKNQFRELQKELQLFAPKQECINDVVQLTNAIQELNYPIIFKPSLCSGSRGTKKYSKYDKEKMVESVEQCIAYSRDNSCVIEEYIEMPSLLVLEGDLFVCGDRICYDGLFFTKRSEHLPMVPMTYMYPYVDSEERLNVIKTTFDLIFKELNICHGQFNIEGYFDKFGNLFVIEINCRQGGHGLPAFINAATGIDMDRMLVTTAMGDNSYFMEIANRKNLCKYVTRHALFSDYSGTFEGVFIDDKIKKYVTNIEIEKTVGEHVEKRTNGSSVIGFVNLLFSSYEEQHFYSEKLEQYFQVRVKGEANE